VRILEKLKRNRGG